MAMEDATLVKNIKPGYVLRSNAYNEEFSLQGEMLVGREVECAISITSGHVSRYHAKINVSPNGVYVEDLHSTNGTFVNGHKIKGRVRLSVGDEIAFDDQVFRLASSRSGAEDATALKPLRHNLYTTTPPSLVPSINSVKTPSQAPDSIENKVNELRSSPLDELDNIELVAPRSPERDKQPAPSAQISTPSASKTDAELMPEAPPADEDQQSEDRTRILSTEHLANILERHRDEKILSLGSGPRFIVMTAPIRGKVIQLDSLPNTYSWQIGRDPQAEICLNDKTISNDHARLSLNANGGFTLMATHAKNGIHINGHLANKVQLHHDDKIQIGRTELVFKTDIAEPKEDPATQNKRDQLEELKMRKFGLLATVISIAVLALALVFTRR